MQIENNFYDLFKFSPSPMWVFEIETLQFLEVNDAAVRDYGYTREEFLSMSIERIRPAEDVPEILKIVKKNSRSRHIYHNVFRHLTKSGNLMYVQVSSNQILFAGKKARLVTAVNVTEKIEDQQKLQITERRFKALVQDGSDMITIIDEHFKYKYVSPASKRVFGVDQTFFIGKKAFDFIHPEDKKNVEREALGIWHNKTIQLSPYRYRDINGKWLWIETTATNLFNDDAVKGIVCTSKDITERINAEKQIAENIERFNIVSKATNDVIWDCDLKKGELLWNDAIKEVLKYNDIHTSLTWWKSLIHPKDKVRVIEKLDQDIRDGKTKWTDEYRFLCGDGTYRNFYDRAFITFNEHGKSIRMIGAMQDITLRKREEEWSKLLESVVVNTSDGVLITDEASTETKIIYVNQAMLNMSGYTQEELIGNSPKILHGKNTKQKDLALLQQAIEDKTEITVELLNYTKLGVAYHVSVSITPIFAADGELIRWISIQRDITERFKYVQYIEKQNKKLKEISWLQSHVVRTPLARIMSISELLKQSYPDNTQKELLDILDQSAHQLDEIIRDIANNT